MSRSVSFGRVTSRGRWTMTTAGLWALPALVWAASVPAEPRVLFDNGQTQPIPFPTVMTVEPASTPSRRPAPAGMDRTSLSAERRLPIRTPGMQVGALAPGVVAAIKPNLQYLSQPFFVIGSDTYSLQWLRHYRARLIQVGAVGLLVQAETSTDLAQVAEAGQGLTIAPVSGVTLVQSLKLTNYPVLISQQGIEQ